MTEKLPFNNQHENVRTTYNSQHATAFGKIKKQNQIIVGFALETNDELENARKKLLSKNMDFIVLNSLNDKGAGFGYDTNKVTIIDRNNIIDNFELKSKDEVASDILNKVITLKP